MAPCKLIVLVLLAAAASAATARAAEDAKPASEDPATPIERSVRPHHVYLIGPLIVSRPRLDLDKPDVAASGYMVVDNRGGSDRLIGATVAGADAVALDGGPGGDPSQPAGIAVPANGRLVLDARGPHLLVHNPAHPPASGVPVAGTLVFAHAGTLHLSFATSDSTSDADDQSDPPPANPEPLQQ